MYIALRHAIAYRLTFSLSLESLPGLPYGRTKRCEKKYFRMLTDACRIACTFVSPERRRCYLTFCLSSVN